MSDLYQKLANSPVGKSVVQALNLPAPLILERYRDASSMSARGDVLLGGSNGAEMIDAIAAALESSHANLHYPAERSEIMGKIAGKASRVEITALPESQRFKVLAFDASGIKNSEELKELYEFFHPVIRALEKFARVLIVGRPPEACDPAMAAAQRGLWGFAKSVGKEIGKKGAVCNLIYVAKGKEGSIESSVQFFCSPRCAYVSGQALFIDGKGKAEKVADAARPLADKIALVTGAARGIGEAIAEVLARYGAKVICLDVPQAESDLTKVAERIGGVALTQDITKEDAGEVIAAAAKKLGAGLDIIVHNAGVTRDKTLGRMKPHFWDLLININLTAMERINSYLIDKGAINNNGRIIDIASISGIAGNFGQTNYAASKAGVIGYVEAMKSKLTKGVTINAVAPGFIETQMTDQIPFTIREAGRRMNSLSQGGQPEDVAELIALYAHPGSQAVNGNVVRVCGLSLIGA